MFSKRGLTRFVGRGRELDHLGQTRDLPADGLLVERLGDVVFRAALDGVHRGFDGCIPGHDDDRDIRVASPQLRGEAETVRHGHDQIDEGNRDPRV